MKFESWQSVVEYCGEHGQVLEGETAEGIANAKLKSGEIMAVEEGYATRSTSGDTESCI